MAMALRGAVLARLIADPLVGAGHIEVRGESGRVKLSGYVTSDAQKGAARAAARRVQGVEGVADDVMVAVPCPDRSEVRASPTLRANPTGLAAHGIRP